MNHKWFLLGFFCIVLCMFFVQLSHGDTTIYNVSYSSGSLTDSYILPGGTLRNDSEYLTLEYNMQSSGSGNTHCNIFLDGSALIPDYFTANAYGQKLKIRLMRTSSNNFMAVSEWSALKQDYSWVQYYITNSSTNWANNHTISYSDTDSKNKLIMATIVYSSTYQEISSGGGSTGMTDYQFWVLATFLGITMVMLCVIAARYIWFFIGTEAL